MSKLVAAACLSLSLVACGGIEPGDLQTDEFSSIEQGQGLPPSCPSGQTLMYWVETYGLCGSCTVSRQPGQKGNQYAACSGNISGTKKLINASYCTLGCGLQ